MNAAGLNAVFLARRLPILLVAVLAAMIAAPFAHAAPPTPAPSTPNPTDPAAADFFEKKIRPVLAQQCFKCHAAGAEKLKGGLLLDSRDALLRGGDSGAAIVPGHPEKSLLIEAVRYSNDDLKMPPKTRLSESVVADLTRWVQMGAPWPGQPDHPVAVTAQPAGPQSLKNLAGVPYDKLRTEHWAWQPVGSRFSTTPPAVRNAAWPKSDIDRFVLAKLESNGLHPVGDADRVTLIRRATFDLTGLPPTAQEVNDFVRDTSPNAFEKLVDRLLASPRFGERWGRHWLDVARYAESTGSARNVPYSYAWRYRDYVINAFNSDKPFNQFVTEQVAGDLLPYKTPAQHNEQLIATGFLALGVKDLNEKDRLKYEMDNVDEQIDVTTRAVMGLTVACARCHDHKFDPIPTTDYYALAGIFRSTEILAGVRGKRGGAGKDYDAPNLLLRLDGSSGAGAAVASAPINSVDAAKVRTLAAKIAESKAALQDLQSERGKLGGGKAAKQAAKQPGARRVQREIAAKQAEISDLEAQLAALQPGGNATTTEAGARAVGVRDASSIADSRICIRGDTDNLGPSVPRGMISLFHVGSQPSISSAHSGRLELAQWMTASDNPLTPRVIVNRVWQHLFGEGIVRSVDNFGTTGDLPTNPELLDYLAARFVRDPSAAGQGDGWSIKRLIRSVMLSRTYQLAGTYDPADAAVDPSDVHVWRMAPKRLEAEALRDAMLAASGRLDLNPPRGSPVESLPVGQIGGKKGRGGEREFDSTHRSVYLPVMRGLLPEVLDVFDFAEPALVTGSRDVTTVATQALYLMNNPFVLEQSKALAQRLLSDAKVDDAGRVDLAYGRVLGRSATAPERQRALQYVGSFASADRASQKDASPREEAWASLCQALFASAEFRYVR